MNEFSLIDHFFKTSAIMRDDVIYGIGDDAACLSLPPDHQLLVSTDTLVADVHFLSTWDPYDIAWKAVMVNVSDMAAMAAMPCWISLALTLPNYDESWLTRFSQGLHQALKQFNIALIGGDTTRGPLSLTLTIHGIAPTGAAIRRAGAQAGDIIWVSGELGAATQAVAFLDENIRKKFNVSAVDDKKLLNKLQHPCPRVDLTPLLRAFASAAIDISDGLSADLNHICHNSQVGACLTLASIPIHPLVTKYQGKSAIDVALTGGDDYELCFTTSPQNNQALANALTQASLICYPIGVIEAQPGLRIMDEQGRLSQLIARGYSHF